MFLTNKLVFKSIYILLITLLIICILFAGKFLVIYDFPKKVDVIIVLSGETGRLEQGLDLYKLGYAENLILSNSNAFLKSKNLVMNIPKQHLFLEDKAMSTSDNAIFTKKIMKDQHFESAIIVSSDYHMRRVKMNFEGVFEKDKIQFIYIGNKTGYKPNLWWLQRSSLIMTIAEYIKMFGNVLDIHGPEEKTKLYKLKKWFGGD